MNDQYLTMGSLFDGSGGFPLAATLNGIIPIWSSEIEPYPIKVTRRRFPSMKHYGDISKISGKEIEPVDIITFGSPCQDMSLAGKRKGMLSTCSKCHSEYKITEENKICPQCGAELEKTRSGLFVEAIRIIKEMREATNEKYPQFIVWENVPGAYSSNKGEDFRTVLEEICSIKDHSLSIPNPKKNKWLKAGEILGDNYSVAWRTLDAQHWGVPQRRRRIYLVADFGGTSASKILFECCRLPWNIEESGEEKQGASGCSEGSIGKTGTGNGVIYGISKTAWTSGANFVCNPTITENIIPTLTTGEAHAVSYEKYVFENHGQDARYTGPLEVTPTIAAYHANSNNQPFVVNCIQGSMIGRSDENGPKGSGISEDTCFTLNTIDRHAVSALIDRSFIPYGISSYESNAMKADSPHSGIYEATVSRTLDQSGGNPSCNQGGIAICFTRGNYMQSVTEASNPLMARDYKDPQAVCVNPAYSFDRASFNQGQNAQFGISIQEEQSQTIVSKGPNAVAQSECNDKSHYFVRRLTPLECSRLQGFPDWWTSGTEIEEPSEEEMQFWRDVFETHRKVVTGAKKPKTDNQIRKWLKTPSSDGAIYKMWGNGIALPCALAVFYGIVSALKTEKENK